jgi:uncharacterized protein YjbI with pentapeptide repeats
VIVRRTSKRRSPSWDACPAWQAQPRGLSRVDLSRSDLGHTDLAEWDLHFSDLSQSFLIGANLRRADLTGVDHRSPST